MADDATTTATTTTTAATTDATATSTTAQKPWYEGQADAETVGHWDNKGWDKTNPAKIAIEATKAAREAQKFVGVPPDQLVKLPRDAGDAAGWKAVWSRLGVPSEAKDYDLSAVKFADGTELDATFSDTMRAALLTANVAKDRASEVVKAVVKHLDDAKTVASSQAAAKMLEQKALLERNWGPESSPSFKRNMYIADQTALTLGVSGEQLSALKNVLGGAQVSEMFRQIGMKTGEPAWVGSGGNTGPMTRDGAVARLKELKGDADWVARYTRGDSKARTEFSDLTTIIAGEQAA